MGGLAAPRVDALLFGESQGRVVVAVKDEAAVLAAACLAGVPASVIGRVTRGRKLSVAAGPVSAAWSVAELRRVWETSIESAMARPGLD